MPQMAPLPWLFLMVFFVMTLMIFVMQIYHNTTFKTPKISMQLTIINKNWLW